MRFGSDDRSPESIQFSLAHLETEGEHAGKLRLQLRGGALVAGRVRYGKGGKVKAAEWWESAGPGSGAGPG